MVGTGICVKFYRKFMQSIDLSLYSAYICIITIAQNTIPISPMKTFPLYPAVGPLSLDELAALPVGTSLKLAAFPPCAFLLSCDSDELAEVNDRNDAAYTHVAYNEGTDMLWGVVAVYNPNAVTPGIGLDSVATKLQ